jgi:putative heme transporter
MSPNVSVSPPDRFRETVEGEPPDRAVRDWVPHASYRGRRGANLVSSESDRQSSAWNAATTQGDAVSLAIKPRLRRIGIGSWLVVGILALAAIVLLLIAVLSGVVIPLAIAGVLAAVLVPLTDWLERHRVPRWLAAVLILILGLALVVVVAAMVINGIAQQRDEIWAQLDAGLRDLNTRFGGSADGAASLVDAARDVVHVLTKGVLGSFASSIGVVIVSSALAMFMLLFLLKDWRQIVDWIVGHIPVSSRIGHSVIDSVVNSFRAYVKALTVLGVANGVVVGIGAWALGLPLVGTIAVVSFVTSYVPFIGAFVAGAFAVLVAYGSGGSDVAIAMLVIVVLTNGLLQNLLEPFAFGRYLRLHPLAVVIVVAAASMLFGLLGAIFAAPLTSAMISAYHATREPELAVDIHATENDQ